MPDRPRQPDVELRLALAMRGGVSLAVWIGGACCEIDALRTATTTRNFWSDWLRRSGYERVVVDVLAGASAGGLNGVLYAASQVYGFPYEKMRDIWLRLGSTESLLRREAPYPSLFQGDDYFQREVTANLHRLINDAVPPDRPPAVDLSLSVTYVEPLERPVPSPNDQRLTERRFASGFVFRHPGADAGWKHTDFPDQDGDRRRFDEAIAQLGLAGRATSSFPGAFEAAAMTARRVERFGDDRPPALPDDAVLDMGGVLMDRAETPLPGQSDPPVFVTDDGGILDNIPIGRALDAVAGAAADQRTDRLVVYLQPGGSGSAHHSTPATTATAGTSLADRRNTISVLRGMARSRLGDETINADIAELERQNTDIERAIAIRRSTYAPIDGAAGAVAAATAQWAGYRLNRALEDAHRIARLLADPVGALGHDPFPRKLAGMPVRDDAWRSPLAGWPSIERTELPGAFANRFEAGGTQLGVGGLGVKPLLRVCCLLIEVARYHEATGTRRSRRTTGSAVKSTLYRTQAVVEQLRDTPRELTWVAAAVRQSGRIANDGVAGLAGRLAAMAPPLVDALCWFDPTDVDTVVRVCLGKPGADLGDLPERTMSRVDEVIRRGADPLPGTVDIRGALLHDVLGRCARLLAKMPAPDHRDVTPAARLARTLRPAADAPPVEQVLAALEVLSFSEFVHGSPGRRPIRYVRMSSENRTPLAPAFTKVLAAAEARNLWWGDSDDPDEQQGIHVDLKLAGNELANFAAFLLPEWRANDWMWGQLDAVPTMVDQLVTVDAVRALLGEHGGDVDAVTAHLLSDDHPWSGPPFKWRTLRDALQRELRAIAGDTTSKSSAFDLTTIRNALIATRQWEILDHDLGESWNPMEPPPAGTVDVRAELRRRPFGAETVREPEPQHADALRDRLDEIVVTVGETVVTNVAALKPTALTPRRAQAVRMLVKAIGSFVTGRLLGKRRRSERSGVVRATLALVGVAIIGAAVLGFVRDRWAFFLGIGVALVVLVIPAWKIRRWVRGLIDDEPAAAPGQARQPRP